MTRTRRRGFTLVELMVVMGLVIVLAALAVAVSESGAFGSQKVVSAGDRASGWLLIAKQRAIRDGRPRGVRFLLNPTADPTLFACREAQYIEVPDAWVPDRSPTRPVNQRAFLAFVYQQAAPGGGLFPDTWINQASYGRSAATPNGHRVLAVFPDPAEYAEFQQRVAAGSMLRLPASNATYRIDQILGPVPLTVGGFPPGTVGYDLVLGQNTANPPPYQPATPAPAGRMPPVFTYPDLGAGFTAAPPTAAPTPTAVEYNFAFTAGFTGSGAGGAGGPQPLVGEPFLQLTGNTVIDVRRYPSTLAFASNQFFNTTFTNQAGNTAAGEPPVAYPTTAGVTVSGDATTGFFIDVLFSPSGQVLGTSDSLLCLWVRDPDKTAQPRHFPAAASAEQRADATNTQGFDYAGEQKLVVVYTRTGLIATHEILPPTGQPTYDPYTAARDGLNSGL